MTEQPRFLQFVLRQMQLAERVVIGLWASAAAGCLAIFASAIPYIFAQEDRIRCGSLGLTRFAITLLPQCLYIIVIATAVFSAGRGLTLASKGRRASGLSIAGGILWSSMAFAGTFQFMWSLHKVAMLIADPPPLPADLTNTRVCNEFIVNAKPYDPVMEWILQHSEQLSPVPNR